MSSARALVCGASIAGLSTAYWLSRAGWEVVVLERAAAFRDGGQNVDVRGVARTVVQRMSLEDQVRVRTTTEQGTSVVDDHGKVIAAFPVEEEDGPTAELEILRGDLARTILEALPQRVQIRYGDWVEDVDPGSSAATQELPCPPSADPQETGSGNAPAHGRAGVAASPDTADNAGSGAGEEEGAGPARHVHGQAGRSARVTLHSGAVEEVDLVVVAEGVRSQTRDRVFGDAVKRRTLSRPDSEGGSQPTGG